MLNPFKLRKNYFKLVSQYHLAAVKVNLLPHYCSLQTLGQVKIGETYSSSDFQMEAAKLLAHFNSLLELL